jgi:hypothetical protein
MLANDGELDGKRYLSHAAMRNSSNFSNFVQRVLTWRRSKTPPLWFRSETVICLR